MRACGGMRRYVAAVRELLAAGPEVATAAADAIRSKLLEQDTYRQHVSGGRAGGLRLCVLRGGG